MLRLDVRCETILSQHLRANRTDRADRDILTGETELFVGAVLGGNSKQVLDLRAVGEKRNVYIAAQDFLNRVAQRGKVFRQSPAIYRNRFDAGAALLQACNKFRVGNAVFLNDDLLTAHSRSGVESDKHLAPRVWLGDGHRRNQSQLFKCRDRLRTARDQLSFPERRNDSFLRILGEERLIECPCADAGHENQQVELTGLELRQQLERCPVFCQRNFTHRRAVVTPNQLGHFLSATAFEGDDLKPVQVLLRVRTHKTADSLAAERTTVTYPPMKQHHRQRSTRVVRPARFC